MQRTGMSEFLRWFQEHIGHEECAFSKVEVAKIDESTGYGLFAKQNIRVNDVLLKIPDRFLITAHFVAKIPEYVECALEKLHFAPAEVLALFFAFERVYFDCICNKIPPADNGNTLINERSLDKCNAHGYEQFLRRRREKTVHEGQNASDALWWKFYIGVLPRHFGTPLFQHYMAEDADARIKAIAAQLPHQMRHKLLAQLDELKSFEKKLFHVLFDPSDGFSELLKNENLIEKIEAVNVDQHFVNGESRLFWKEICCWSWHIVNTRSIFVDNLANGKDEKGAVKTRHMERRRKKMNGQEEQQQQQEEEYGGSLALIPLVDLFNHRPNAQCVPTWDRRSNCYLVIAEQHIISGQQLFLCYGAHENARLWIEYGFRMHENPLDRVSIPIELFIVLAERSGIRVSAKKKEILAKANLPCTIYASDDLPSYALRKNCSILQLTNDKLSKWSQYIFAPSMKEEDAEDQQEAEDRQEMELLKKILNLLTKALICRREECLDVELRPFWTDQIQILQKMMLNLESFIK